MVAPNFEPRMTTWLLLSIFSALLLGLYDVAKKASLDENAVLAVLFACSAIGLVLISPAPILTWLAPASAARLGLLIEPLPWRAHGLVLIKAAIVTTSWGLNFFAIKHLPISIASPIRASAPLFVLLGAVLLFGEQPTSRQWAGIAAILASYWAFSLIGRAEGIHFSSNRYVWLLFAGTLVGAVSGLYDKHLLQGARLPPLTMQLWFTAYNTMLQGLIAALVWWPRRNKTSPFRWRWSIVAVAALLLGADNLYFRALALPGALVAVVSLVRRTNLVVSFAIGSVAFGERNRLRKSGAVAGIVLGLALLLR
jgi:drug/metabolite transporter (DMT)-like permease